MARVFITGSADGLGLLTAQELIATGHEVVLHARNSSRAEQAVASAPGAGGVLVGELSSLAQIRQLADQANAFGTFDAVLHNAGIGYREASRVLTDDGVERVFQINVVTPYALTAWIKPPTRLVYMSSGVHLEGSVAVDDLNWEDRPWSGYQAYCDSKLFDTMLAFAAARRWPGTVATSVDPGWVPTKMGGDQAPDDLRQGFETQVWLASGAASPQESGSLHVFHKQPVDPHPGARDTDAQDALLDACERITGVAWPAPSA